MKPQYLLLILSVCTAAEAAITYQKYDDIGGYQMDHLRQHPSFPDHPDTSFQLQSMQAPANVDDHYGARLSGYLTPPESGSYTFWIASDNHGELWLSSDSLEEHKVKISHHQGWTGQTEWDKFDTQKSAGVELSAGQRYFIEALVKEVDQGDHLSVGWRKPSDGSGKSPAEIISGDVLSAYAEAQIRYADADAGSCDGGLCDTDTDTVRYSAAHPAFIKFNLAGLQDIRKAELQLYCRDRGGFQLYIRPVPDDNWSENADQVPVPDQTVLDSATVGRTGFYRLDVTDFIKTEHANDSMATLCVTSEAGSGHSFASRTSQNPPQLLLNFSGSGVTQPSVPEGARLRDIAAARYPDGNVIIGATTGAWAFGTYTGQIMDREFSYVTPENDFKQPNIHPDNSDDWNWEETDAWIEHIKENDQILRMHGPVSPQCSQWAKTDSRTAEELEQNMTDFMRELCKRYNNEARVVSMDVVNEIVIDGKWHGTKAGNDSWECPWIKIGRDTDENKTPLYIKKAFEIANQYATRKTLILNHHEHPYNRESWDLIKETVFYLRAQDLRVDGIGWQAHVDVSWAHTLFYAEAYIEALRDLIDWAHAHDLEFHVTEASVWMSNGMSERELEKQAETYSTIVRVLLEKRNSGPVGWNTWHIDDAHGWKTDLFPSLFDAEYRAKPAYYAVQDVLANPPQVTSADESGLQTGLQFNLWQNYPNPFNPVTTIEYSLPQNGPVTLSVYDIRGRRLFDILDSQQSAGTHRLQWNAENLASGVYYYQIRTGSYRAVRKCVLIK